MPDSSILFLNMDLFWLIAALGGGAFGAAIGANRAFGFTGIMVLAGLGVAAGTGSTALLDYGAFGPVFGPHITFMGGMVAAAYAGAPSRKLLPDTGQGRDVSTPLITLNRPDVLVVGAITGAVGYVLEKLVQLIPWFGTHTDAITFVIFFVGIFCRIVWSDTKVFHAPTAPEGSKRWLAYQEKPAQFLTLGTFTGLFAGGLAMMLASYIKPLGLEDATYTAMIDNAHVLPFAISAITVIFLASGAPLPVTHHITISAAFAAVTFWNISGSGLVGLVAGAAMGALSAFVGEMIAKLTFYHGDTHIDPPAGTIWMMNTLVALLAMPFAA